MPYNKSFATKITIYPEFYSDMYFDYVIKSINNWIDACHAVYKTTFAIKAEQQSGIAKLYSYEGTPDIYDLSKLWRNKYSKYDICFFGSGDVIDAISKSVEPPHELMDVSFSNIEFRYMEYSDYKGLNTLSFGRTLGVPKTYSFDDNHTEDWHKNTEDIDVISKGWVLEISAGQKALNAISSLVDELMELNQTYDSLAKTVEDEGIMFGSTDIGSIYVDGQFVLKAADKKKYKDILKKISTEILNDEMASVDKYKMEFISLKPNNFYFEVYNFSELDLLFHVKTLNI